MLGKVGTERSRAGLVSCELAIGAISRSHEEKTYFPDVSVDSLPDSLDGSDLGVFINSWFAT